MPSRTVSIVLTGTNASAVKAIAGVETAAAKAGAGASGHMEKSAGKIGVAFHALDQQLSAFGVPFAGTFGLVGSTLEKAEGKTKSFGSTLSKIGAIELTAAVIGLAAVGSEAVHLADDLEQAHAREVTAITNAGGAYDQYASRIRTTESQMEKFGFTNAETDSSIANLTNATHDAGKAIDLQGLAADIARGRHIGLTEATAILMKVETGHVALLGKLGINIKDASGKVISQDEAIKRLSATYKGQAAAAADTFAGKMKTLSTTVQDVGAKLGENIVPKVEAVASAISGGVTSFEDFNSTLDGVPGKVLAVGAAFPAIFFAGSKIVDGLKGVGTAVSDAVGRFGRFTGIMGEVAGAEDGVTGATDSNTAATATNTASKSAKIAAAEAQIATMKTEVAAEEAAIVATDGDTAATASNTAAKTTRIAALEASVATMRSEVGAANAGATATLDQEAAYAGLTGTLDSATIATHALTQADTDQIAVWATLSGEEEAAALNLAAFKTVEEETVATTGILATTTGALGSVFGTVGGALTALTAGFLLGKTAGDKINSVLDGTKPNVEDLTKDFTYLAETHQVAGVAASKFGVDLSGLAHDLGKVSGVRIPGTNFEYFRSGARQARGDIAAVNQALEGILKTQGVKPAYAAFEQIRNQLLSLGVSVETIDQAFNPFLHRVGEEVPAAAHAAGDAVAGLGAQFSAFATSLDKADAGLKIADSFDAISTAADKVTADKADLAGTSKTATEANRSEATALQGLSNSYDGLRNSQEGVSTAAHTLLQAQQALDQYNSPRGVKERSLQLDIIRRRVVSTPAESDQKQLDLLQFDDTNARKKQQLQDAVIAGQKGLADAEKGVVTATRAVSDAQQTVADAVARRKAVHDDAAKAIAGDERKVQEAVNSTVALMATAISKGELSNTQIKVWSGYLDVLAQTYAPGSTLSKNIDSFYKKLIKSEQDASLQTSIDKAGDSAFNPPGSTKGRGSTHNPKPTPHTVDLLHQLGVSGFAAGGIAENHVAQIVAPAARIWAEPETGGEAYIPLAPAKRSRSRDILSTVAEKFGLRLTGSTPTAPAAPADAPSVEKKVQRFAEGGVIRVTHAKVRPDELRRVRQGIVPQAASPVVTAGPLSTIAPTSPRGSAVAHSGNAASVKAVPPAAERAGAKTELPPAPSRAAAPAAAHITTNVTSAASPAISQPADRAAQKIEGASRTIASSSASFQSLTQRTLSVEKAAPAIVRNEKVPVTPARSSLPRPTVLPVRPLVTTTTVQHTVNAPQTINFHGAQTPTLAELEYLNREQGWRLSRTGRSG